MRRYRRLEKQDVHEALNRLRDSFLAARDGNEVDKILDGLLTHDEKLKIGRRIVIADWIKEGLSLRTIAAHLKVGKNTILHVSRRLEKYEECFELIRRRTKIVEKVYKSKSHNSVGSSLMIKRRKEWTGFRRKDVKRQ